MNWIEKSIGEISDMATTTVVINDFTNNRRTVTILDNRQYDLVAQAWGNEDSILVDMQRNAFFAGRTRWCDLNPTHFRLMVAHNMTLAAKLPDDEHADPKHPVIKSLNFLMCGLVLCLQYRTECLIELLRIARMSETEITYDFSASLNMAIDTQKPKNGLRIVVDNE
jgi:hypothetical protein